MYIVYGHTELFFPYCSSLKEKRRILQSIIARVRKRFNISICEVEHHELWQRSKIGFTAVSGNFPEITLITSAIHDTLLNHADQAEILAFEHQTLRADQ
jgi:uncharacterized protein YlxP (DUF503 family)